MGFRAVAFVAVLALVSAAGAATGVGLGVVQTLTLPPAPGELILHETLFEKLTAKILPVLIEVARKITVPGHSEKHFSYGTIRLSEFNIKGFSIGFQAPNKVVLSLKQLSMAVPHTSFEVKDKIVFVHVHCSGHVWANIDDVSIVADMGIGRSSNGRLRLDGVTDSVSFGKVSIGHRFDHFLCRVAGHIVEAFIGNINHKIEGMIKSKVGPIIVKELTTVLEKALPKVPVQMMSAPVATSRGISFTVNVLSLLHSKESLFVADTPRGALRSVIQTPSTPAIGAASSGRDIAVGISSGAANILMEYAAEAGFFHHVVKTKFTTAVFKKYLPTAYEACPDCPVRVPWEIREPPKLTFLTGLAFNTKGVSVSLEAINRTTGRVVPLVNLKGNTSGIATNFSTTGAHHNVLHMAFAVPTFDFIATGSSIGPLEAYVIPKLASFAVHDVIIPFVNDYLRSHGVIVPTLAKVFTPEDILVEFFNAQAYFGANVLMDF